MKKKYLKPSCKLSLLTDLQVMAGSFGISDEGTDDQWAKENNTDDESSIKNHSVWDD